MPAHDPALSALAEATYVSLRTFRRDGSSADTPVWVARLDGSLVLFTDGTSWKVKRVRANPHCAVAICNAAGTVSGEWVPGSAHVVVEPERERRAFETLRAKYGLRMRVLDLVSWIGGRIGRLVVLEVVLSGKNTASLITT